MSFVNSDRKNGLCVTSIKPLGGSSGAQTSEVWINSWDWQLNLKSKKSRTCFEGCLTVTWSGLALSTGEHWRMQAETTQPMVRRTLEPPKGNWVQAVALAHTLVLGCAWTRHLQDHTFSGQLSRQLYLLYNPLLKYSNKSHISTQMQPLGKIHPSSWVLVSNDPWEVIGKIKTPCFQLPLKTHQVQTLAVNPECKRHFSKVYCSPNDNNAILTNFRGTLGVWGKKNQSSKQAL